MLRKENFRQTLRLTLLGAFSDTEPELTTTLQELYQQCPTLFATLLPRSELETRAELLDVEESYLAVTGDAEHLRPSAVGKLAPKYVRDILKLPTRASQTLPQEFRTGFRIAFDIDYGMPNERQYGKQAFSWCKRIGFDDRYVRSLAPWFLYTVRIRKWY